jgi:pyruvate dehydrogenase E2 component (dihydrolipoamide acetyltransferase)
MPDFLMPRLSDTMEEGTIAAWLKADGDTVAPGEPLVEIETDKATMSCDAELAGTLTIVLGVGETAPVGAPIAVIGDGAAAPPVQPGAAAEAPTSDPAPAPAPAPAEVRPSPAATLAASPDGAIRASPVARRMARELGIDLGTIAASGPHGRVLRADVEGAAAAAAAPPPAANGRVVDSGRGEVDRRDLSRLQSIIARRMVQSKSEAPEFFLTIDVDMTDAVALRTELQSIAAPGEPVPSFNDFVVRGAAFALARHPLANAAFVDGAIERYSRVNVGIAVASEGSLVVPTVFDADRKSLGTIARETRRLAAAAREGSVTPADLSGGTFTVSNLGMFGIQHFTAVLNPPQSAILAVGKLEPRPVWRDEAFVPRSMMTMTLTCDHRILYGADAARFLAGIRDLLERPLQLAL